MDSIAAAPKLDTVILFTGDGDFVPLVEYLQMHSGCQVEVVSFGRSTSQKLKEAADDFFDLDEEPKRYLINYRGPSPRRSARSKQEFEDVDNNEPTATERERLNSED